MPLIYALVAVDSPLNFPLTYTHDLSRFFITPGQSVWVPLGSRKVKGVIIGISEEPPQELKGKKLELKSIIDLVDNRPVLDSKYLEWLKWISEYYLAPIGSVCALAFPTLEKKTGIRKSKKKPVVTSVERTIPPELTLDQQEVIQSLNLSSEFSVHLLHGVTGSGKTEVYLSAIDATLARKQQSLILVPEISLTPQLIHRFSARFGDNLAVLHSHLTPREKTDQWWLAYSQEKKILIGARSALFCPLENLGLIILDEEHEPSYKQDEKLKYHARDSAIVLAKNRNCPIILGSATPSLESWHNAQTGKYKLHSMKSRVAERQLPHVIVLDLKEERRLRKDPDSQTRTPAPPFWMSQKLLDELELTFKTGQQAALFLNRRGIAQSALCSACGWTPSCPNCAISLTLHNRSDLVCHYCDYNEHLLSHCPQCQSPDVKPLGLGTELLENDMKKLFPEIRIARADRDEIQNREAMEQLIQSVENREVDLLIGTQMIAKGLDFPGLTLVGIVMADVGFSMPDFRASERSFQLLTQVSGRAGRHSSTPGQVIIQTYNPTHPAILKTQSHNYIEFAEEELVIRRELFYPPFSRTALIRIQSQLIKNAELAAQILRQRGESLVKQRQEYSSVRFLGPSEAPMPKLRGQFRFHALLKAPTPLLLRNFCRQILGDESWLPKSTKASIDIDPMNML